MCESLSGVGVYKMGFFFFRSGLMRACDGGDWALALNELCMVFCLSDEAELSLDGQVVLKGS